jgi:transcriptional regulator with XRE-family HTH domain
LWIVNGLFICLAACHFFVVPERRTKLQPEREREIGARVKEARERLRYSQAEFAGFLSLTRDQLAAVECGRTPLRYAIAWSLRENFRVSLDWLSGDGLMAMKDMLRWPAPNTPSAPVAAYFSEVLDRVLAGSGDKSEPSAASAVFALDVVRRNLMRQTLHLHIDDELASLPADSLLPFTNAMLAAVKQLAAAFPHLPKEAADQNAADLEAFILRDETRPPKPPPEPPVKAPLPARRRRAPRA